MTDKSAAEGLVSSPASQQEEPDWRDLNRELGCTVAHRSQILKALAAVVDVTKGLLPLHLYDGTSRDEVVALREAYAEAKRVTEEYPLAEVSSPARPQLSELRKVIDYYRVPPDSSNHRLKALIRKLDAWVGAVSAAPPATSEGHAYTYVTHPGEHCAVKYCGLEPKHQLHAGRPWVRMSAAPPALEQLPYQDISEWQDDEYVSVRWVRLADVARLRSPREEEPERSEGEVCRRLDDIRRAKRTAPVPQTED